MHPSRPDAATPPQRLVPVSLAYGDESLRACDGRVAGESAAQRRSRCFRWLPNLSVASKMPGCRRYVFGTLQNEWSSVFLPFIIFLSESRCFSCVLLHTSPRLCMEAKVSSFGSRFPLGTGVPENRSHTAHGGFNTGAWFAVGHTRTVPSPAVSVHATAVRMCGRFQSTCDPTHTRGWPFKVAE